MQYRYRYRYSTTQHSSSFNETPSSSLLYFLLVRCVFLSVCYMCTPYAENNVVERWWEEIEIKGRGEDGGDVLVQAVWIDIDG